MLVKLFNASLICTGLQTLMSLSLTMNADTMQVHTCMDVGYMHGVPKCMPCNNLNAEPPPYNHVHSAYRPGSACLCFACSQLPLYSLLKSSILHVCCRVLQSTITPGLNVRMQLLPYNVNIGPASVTLRRVWLARLA